MPASETATVETIGSDPMMDAINQHNEAVSKGYANGDDPNATPPKEVTAKPVAPEGTDKEAEMLKRRAEVKKKEDEALKTLKKPEEAKPVVKKADKADPLSKLEPLPQSEDDIKKQSRWMELKAAEKERDELRAKHTELEKQYAEAQKKQWKEEERQRFEELQKKERAWEVEKTPEWKQQIEVPFKERENWVNGLANHYGITSDALWSALDLPDPFARGEKIDEVLKTGTKEVPANVSAMVANVGNDLQVIYQAMEKHRRDAFSQANALEADKAQMTEKQQKEYQQQYQTAHEDVAGKLEKKLPSIFGAEDLAIEGVKASDAVRNAKPGEDARTIAYQAQAGELLPYFTQRLMKVEAELKTYKEEATARIAANPGMQKTDVKLPSEKNDGVPKTIEEAMEMEKKYDYRKMR